MFDEISSYLKKPKSESAPKTLVQKKIGINMDEMKAGTLKSSSGEPVTDPKQALAISYSEARRMKNRG